MRRTNILTTPLSLLLKEEEVMKNTGMTLKQVFVETEYLQTVVLILVLVGAVRASNAQVAGEGVFGEVQEPGVRRGGQGGEGGA